MMQRLVLRAIHRGALQRLPESVKAPFRPLIRPDQLYDTELYRIGLECIRPDDVFLCSYPKSGNTWLRFLIASLIRPEDTITFRNINRHVPDIEFTDLDLNRRGKRPPMKTHWPFLHRFPRTIYMCRDPRDVLVSYFHYLTKLGAIRGDLAAFVRAPDLSFGTWDDHVAAALAEKEKRPGDILFLRYEDMLAAPQANVAAVASFLRLEATEETMRQAIEKTSFVRLQENERQYGGERDAADTGFFRKGVSGGWRDEISERDAAEIVARYGAIMRRVGYA